MITFICALPQEARSLRKLSIIQSGKASMVRAGVGPRNAERAARELPSQNKPSLVISAGVAGALVGDLKIGDVVVAKDVIDGSSGDRFACGPHSAIAPRPDASEQVNRQSAILSVSRMITSADEKKMLGRKFNAVAVDMESAAIARVCAAQGVPFAAIRAISDSVDEVLPQAVTRFFDVDGALRPGRVIAALARDPSLWKSLRELQTQTAAAGEALGRFLEEVAW